MRAGLTKLLDGASGDTIGGAAKLAPGVYRVEVSGTLGGGTIALHVAHGTAEPMPMARGFAEPRPEATFARPGSDIVYVGCHGGNVYAELEGSTDAQGVTVTVQHVRAADASLEAQLGIRECV